MKNKSESLNPKGGGGKRGGHSLLSCKFNIFNFFKFEKPEKRKEEMKIWTSIIWLAQIYHSGLDDCTTACSI